METPEFEIDVLEIDLSEKHPTLIFASGGNQNRYKATKVPIFKDVSKELIDTCNQTLTRLRASIPQPYHPDSVADEGSFIYVHESELLDPSLINVLSEGPSADVLDIDEALKTQFCYAVVFGRASEPEAIFIKKSNPVRVPKSQWYARFAGDNSLAKVDTPEITFHDSFDAVVLQGKYVLCWSVKAFNQLFKTEEIVLQYTEKWISEGMQIAPDLISFNLQDLVSQARTNGRVRNKWHAVSSRPPLDETDRIKLWEEANRAAANGIIEVSESRIIVTPKTIDAFFGLINEDDYNGPVTNTRYRAQHKKKIG